MAKIKPDGVIPEIGASCMEEPPLWASVATAFNDEAVRLALGAIAKQESDAKTEGKITKSTSLSKP